MFRLCEFRTVISCGEKNKYRKVGIFCPTVVPCTGDRKNADKKKKLFFCRFDFFLILVGFKVKMTMIDQITTEKGKRNVTRLEGFQLFDESVGGSTYHRVCYNVNLSRQPVDGGGVSCCSIQFFDDCWVLTRSNCVVAAVPSQNL